MKPKTLYQPVIDDFNPILVKQSRGPFKGSNLYQRNKYRFGIVDHVQEFSKIKWVEQIDRRPNSTLLYNFNYQGDLYLAEIPNQELYKVILMKEPFLERFGLTLVHTQMCFIFNHPIILYPQNEGCKLKKATINSLIYSYNFIGGVKKIPNQNMEGTRFKNHVEKYSPINGIWFLRRRYMGTHNISSLNAWIKKEDKALDRIQNQKTKSFRKSPTALISLSLDNMDQERFLKDQLLYGHIHNRLEKRYETLFRNCGNIILRNIFPNIRVRKIKTLKSMCYRVLGHLFPGFTDVSLMAHGVESQKISLNMLKELSIQEDVVEREETK